MSLQNNIKNADIGNSNVSIKLSILLILVSIGHKIKIFFLILQQISIKT